MKKLDRFYDCNDGHVLVTNGHGGVIRTIPEGFSDALKPPNDKMLESLEAWRAVETEDGPLAKLRALLAWPSCDTCKGARTVTCRECHGEGDVDVTCDHCDDVHTHACPDCDGGKVDCRDCNRLVPIALKGRTFDVRLVRLVLEAMDIPDGHESIAYAVVGEDRDRPPQWHVVFRAQGRIGVVMGAYYRDDPPSSIAAWP